MNHGKYDTEQYRLAQQAKVDRIFGPIEIHEKVCEVCNQPFQWIGRLMTKAFEKARFCSRSCANFRGASEKWRKSRKRIARKYQTVCKQHHERVCVVCGIDEVIEVHHIDEDRTNNDPSNLVPLCPTHHRMVHKEEYREEIQKVISNYISLWKKENSYV